MILFCFLEEERLSLPLLGERKKMKPEKVGQKTADSCLVDTVLRQRKREISFISLQTSSDIELSFSTEWLTKKKENRGSGRGGWIERERRLNADWSAD